MTDPSPRAPAARQRMHGITFDIPGGLAHWRPTAGDPGTEAPWAIQLDLGPRAAAAAGRDLAGVRVRSQVDMGSITLDVIDPATGRSAALRADLAERRIVVRSDVEEPDSRELIAFVLATRVVPLLARLERDCVALHAVSVSTASGAIAVCGASGSGKSTLAAALVAAGAGLLGEEPVVVEGGAAWAGPAQLRLVDGSPGARCLAGLGWTRRPSWDKSVWEPPGLGPSDEAVALRAVLLLGPREPALPGAPALHRSTGPGAPALHRSTGPGAPALHRLPALDALPELMRQRFPVPGQAPAADLPSMAALAGAVPVLVVRLPPVADDLAGLGRAILAHVEALA